MQDTIGQDSALSSNIIYWSAEQQSERFNGKEQLWFFKN